MKTELAFIVNVDSDFYKLYMTGTFEKIKFVDLAKKFGAEVLKIDGLTCSLTRRLAIKLNEEQKETFANQICKQPTSNGLSIFKKNSTVQKRWEAEVINQINFNLLNKLKFWYMPYTSNGSYSLWNHHGTIYGYLSTNNNKEISCPKFAIEIPMSEYYRALEEAEAEKENVCTRIYALNIHDKTFYFQGAISKAKIPELEAIIKSTPLSSDLNYAKFIADVIKAAHNELGICLTEIKIEKVFQR